jgi:hypothetical protein
VRGDGVVRQVELEHADRPAGGTRDHRLQHPDDLAAALAVRHDRDVGPSGVRRAEGRIGHRDAAGRRAVVGEGDLAGEAAQPQAEHRAVEDRQVGRLLQALPLGGGQPGGQVGVVQGGRDRHLLDDRGLGAALVLTLLGRVAAVGLHHQPAEQRDQHQAGRRIGEEQAGSRTRASSGSAAPHVPHIDAARAD